MSEELLNTIRVASVKLEVENDDHWTNDGLPSLEAVHHFTGNQRIKRGDVTNALPDFNREAARAALEAAAAEPVVPVQAGPAPNTSVLDANGFVLPQTHTSEELALKECDIDARLGDLANQRLAVIAEAEEAKRKVTHLDEEEARLISLKNQLYPPKSFSELIEEHLKATLPREAQKVARAEEVRKTLVDAGVLKEGEKLKTEPNT
jgi:hypothetical protein